MIRLLTPTFEPPHGWLTLGFAGSVVGLPETVSTWLLVSRTTDESWTIVHDCARGAGPAAVRRSAAAQRPIGRVVHRDEARDADFDDVGPHFLAIHVDDPRHAFG